MAMQAATQATLVARGSACTPRRPAAANLHPNRRWHRLGGRGARAAAQGGEGSGPDNGAEPDLRSQARLLTELFYTPDPPQPNADTTSGPTDSSENAAAAAPAPRPTLLPDLPLWRVQWAALPGHQEVLHVHVPHYCAMFERLFRGPRPWRFGHLYLPEGSKNLGNPEFALAPGTKAPLAGTLMEALQVVRFPDGRLLILAVGVGRLRAVRSRQDVPYCRADAEVLLDAEEQQQLEGLALRAAESLGGGGESGDVPLAALMAAVPAAAREAAAAHSRAWLDYELSEERAAGESGVGVIDGSRAEEAQVMGRRLAAIAGNEVPPLPFWEPLGQALRAALDSAASGAEEGGGGGGGGDILQQALAAQRSVLRQVEAAAYAQATSAAAASVALHLAPGGGAGGGAREAAAAGQAAGPPPALNTASERGLAVRAAEDVLSSEECLSEQPESLAAALQLEAAVWAEIDAVHGLASKLRDRLAPLPDGVRCLRPWQPAAAGAAAGEQAAAAAAGAPPDYPALRRVQRLSFAVTAMLANVSAAEGRQAWLEAGSACARLRMGLAALRRHRQVLAAVVAVEGL